MVEKGKVSSAAASYVFAVRISMLQLRGARFLEGCVLRIFRKKIAEVSGILAE